MKRKYYALFFASGLASLMLSSSFADENSKKEEVSSPVESPEDPAKLKKSLEGPGPEKEKPKKSTFSSDVRKAETHEMTAKASPKKVIPRPGDCEPGKWSKGVMANESGDLEDLHCVEPEPVGSKK